MRSELKNKIQRDSRSQLSKEIFIKKLKKEYAFKEKIKELEKIEQLLDSSFLIGRWKYVPNKHMQKTIATFADQKILLGDVAKYIENTQRPLDVDDMDEVVYQRYLSYVDNRILNYEKSQLEDKYPEFKSLLKEYRDGILLFEITDEKVWSKGVKDTVGLKEYYEQHKEDFMWPDREKAKIFISSDKKIIDEAYEFVKKGELRNDSIVNYLNRDSQLNVKYEDGIFIIDENEVLKGQSWKKGINEPKKLGDKYVLVVLDQELPSSPKKLDEAKGLVTAAYQNELEEKWIDSLKKKYKVDVNKDVLYTITKKP